MRQAIAVAALALMAVACCGRKRAEPVATSASPSPVATLSPPSPAASDATPKVCSAFGRPTSRPGWPCSESSGCTCGWMRDVGTAPGVNNLPNRETFHAEGTKDGQVTEAWVMAYVNAPLDAPSALSELAKDAGTLAGAIGMGAIPAAADTAIRSGKVAKGVHPGTGQTWSVERRAFEGNPGYSLIFRVKK